ncbi:hypothetical protein PFISCL1PPCAC_4867, partial [Pristionchus fissidentatus]
IKPLALPNSIILLLILVCTFAVISIFLSTFMGVLPTESRITLLSLLPLVHSFQFIVVGVMCVIFYRIFNTIRQFDARLRTLEMMTARGLSHAGYANPNHGSVSRNPSIASSIISNKNAA